MLEIDRLNGVFIVNGKDVLKNVRICVKEVPGWLKKMA